MQHLTLNTGDSADISGKPFDDEILALLKPTVRAAQASPDGTTTKLLPPPFGNEGWGVKISYQADTGIAFDVFKGEHDWGLVAVNMLAWGEDSAFWEMIVETAEKTLAPAGMLPEGGVPPKPDNVPWLATLMIPNPNISVLTVINLGWLADFEQCLAMAFLRFPPPRRRPGGFGR